MIAWFLGNKSQIYFSSLFFKHLYNFSISFLFLKAHFLCGESLMKKVYTRLVEMLKAQIYIHLNSNKRKQLLNLFHPWRLLSVNQCDSMPFKFTAVFSLSLKNSRLFSEALVICFPSVMILYKRQTFIRIAVVILICRKLKKKYTGFFSVPSNNAFFENPSSFNITFSTSLRILFGK